VNGKILVAIAGLAIVTAAPAAAQRVAPQPREQARAMTRQQMQARYHLGVMERVLEDAVEHGYSLWRDRFQAVLPSQTVLLNNARARGYRLDDYGVFFDVEVPSLEATWFSVFRTLDQNGLALQSALRDVKKFIQAAGDPNLEQALRRIELQVAPFGAVAPSVLDAQAVPGPVVTGAAPAPPALPNADPILNDPQDAYRTEVKDALVDAMLEHSGGLQISPEEWLTIGARGNEMRPRLATGDGSTQTFVIRVRGIDLRAFRAGQLSREEAVKRVEVRVF
jgi:hypothetical protein